MQCINRSLRTAPGLRAVGKHWEMDSMSSEIDTDDSDDDNGDESRKNVSIKYKCCMRHKKISLSYIKNRPKMMQKQSQ